MNACNDCIIWVGDSYPTVAADISEARRRGCSRQVPSWPAWAKAGVTRVFLAHRGGKARGESGVVFGYFTLYGVDVIATQKQCDEYKKLLENEEVEPLIRFWEARLDRQLPVSHKHGDEVDDAIKDFLLDLIISCEAPPHQHGSGYILSTNQTALEEPRLCGLRLGPERGKGEGRPSLYFVDALERQIAETFCDALKELIKQALAKNPTKTEKSVWRELRQSERQPFRKIAKRIAASQSIDIGAKAKAFSRAEGALVVFDKPYPFRRAPSAAFRGFLRVDGDELLRRVAAHNGGKQPTAERYTLPYCGEETARPGKAARTSQLATEMAHDLRMNVANARRVLGWLAATIQRELAQNELIRLTDIGTLRVRKKGDRKLVKFKASSVLRRNL
jgi:nucleoid DNA-binding protein